MEELDSSWVDLSPYVNHNIKIQFTAFDCTPGGHFGYAYIACSCGAFELAQQCKGNADTLTAPAGFAAYAWDIVTSTLDRHPNNTINYC